METYIHQNEHLVNLTLTFDEFISSRIDRKELKLNNQYFDMKCYDIIGNHVYIFGVWDKVEKELKSKYISLHASQNANQILEIFSFLMTPFVLGEESIFEYYLYNELNLAISYFQERPLLGFIDHLWRPPIL